MSAQIDIHKLSGIANMDTNADARTEAPLIDRLAQAGLAAAAIREVFVVFLLLIWAAEHPDEDNTHGFARVLVYRMDSLNLRSAREASIRSGAFRFWRNAPVPQPLSNAR